MAIEAYILIVLGSAALFIVALIFKCIASKKENKS